MISHSRVVPFRTRIAKRYSIWCGVAMLFVIACILLFCLPGTNLFLKILFSSLGAFALWLAISWWVHQRKMLKLLPKDSDSFKAFDEYLTRRLTAWENDTIRRIIVGVILLIATVLFIFYENGRQWLPITSSLLIAFVLFSMLKSWNYYLDGILQHDIRRIDRDQAPDISV